MLSDFNAGLYALTEMSGSPVETRELGNVSARRVFKVAWAGRRALCDALTGSISGTSAVPVKVLTDELPGVPGCYCRRATAEPISGGAVVGSTEGSALAYDTAAYQWAIVTAEYDTRGAAPTDGDQDANAIEEYESNGEFLTTGATGWTWEGNAKQIKADMSPGILVPQTVITVPRLGRRTNPGTAVLPYIGKINSTAFKGSAANTVLYLGARVKQIKQRVGQTVAATYDYEHRFIMKDRDWREVFDPERGVWDKIKKSGGSVYLYTATDLNAILDFA